MADNETEPDEATIEAEHEDATKGSGADRPPTDEESADADRAAEKFAGDKDTVAADYKEMSDIGAHIKGEGEID
jgi:hypothetical protein